MEDLKAMKLAKLKQEVTMQSAASGWKEEYSVPEQWIVPRPAAAGETRVASPSVQV